MARTTAVLGSAWNETWSGVWDSHPGRAPSVAVVAGVHGDEWASVEALKRVLKSVRPEELPAPARLIIANPAALALEARHTPDGTDLNRSFGTHSEPTGEEKERVEVLKMCLSGVPLVLDLHQTHCATPPLAVVPRSGEHFDESLKLGVEVLVTGASTLYEGAMLTDWVDRNGGLGLTFETGEADSSDAEEFAFHLTRDGVFGIRPRAVRRAREFAVNHPVRAPFSGGEWVRPVGNGTAFCAGEVLWRSESDSWEAPEDGVLLLPHTEVNEGDVLAVLARDEGWYER